MATGSEYRLTAGDAEYGAGFLRSGPVVVERVRSRFRLVAGHEIRK
jgi:hypothetical protein